MLILDPFPRTVVSQFADNPDQLDSACSDRPIRLGCLETSVVGTQPSEKLRPASDPVRLMLAFV